MPYNKRFINWVLGPYKEIYEALTFTHGPRNLGQYEKDRASYFWYGPSNPISKSLITSPIFSLQ